MSKIRTYDELISLPTFRERFEYLKLGGGVGDATFGFQRWINQKLYHGTEWLQFRDRIIIRDEGWDLAVPDYTIYSNIIIHHLNPITYDDIVNRNPCIFDPNNVVCTQLNTHNAIHYGDASLLVNPFPIQRVSGETTPWKRKG